jgi:hypothetical protein
MAVSVAIKQFPTHATILLIGLTAMPVLQMHTIRKANRFLTGW